MINNPNFKIVAKNLRKPEGETGLEIANDMNKGNANFYKQLLKLVNWKSGMRVLEIGFGNGNHIPEILAQAENITYVGVDYSKTMVDFASKKFSHQKFYHQDVVSLSLKEEAAFDVVITINTVYFVDDLNLMFNNIKSILSTKGHLYVGKRPKEDMILLNEITQHGFNTYENEEVAKAIMKTGLDIVSVTSSKDPEFKRLGKKITLHSDYIIAQNGN